MNTPLRLVERRDAPVEHGVEGGDLVDAHGGHLEEVGDVVHDGDGRPALVLALAEVEKGDDGGLLVLGRVVGDDFLCTLHVLGGELEWDLLGAERRAIRRARDRRTLGLLYGVSRCCREDMR